MRLAAVLHEPEAALAGEGSKGVQVGHAAVEVDGQYPDGLIGDAPPRVLRVHAREPVAIHEDRRRPGMQDSFDGRERGHRGNENLVAGRDADRLDRELDSGGALRDRDGVGDPDVLGEFPLEGLDLRPQDETPGIHDVEHRLLHLGSHRGSREGDHRRPPAAAPGNGKRKTENDSIISIFPFPFPVSRFPAFQAARTAA